MEDIDETTKKWLAKEDTINKKGRLKRLRWLAKQMPPGDIITFHSEEARYFFEESRYCYIYGQFVASILLGLAFIESSTAAILYAHKRINKERNIIFREAVQEGFFSNKEYEIIKRIQNTWSPITKLNPIDHSDRLYWIALEQKVQINTIIKKDAKFVMGTIFKLIDRFPLI